MSKQTQSSVAIWLGGGLAITLTIGYVVLLAVHVPVPSTFEVILIAVVTHFLGNAVPAAAGNTTVTQLIDALGQALGVSPSTSTTATTTTTTTATPTMATAPDLSSAPSNAPLVNSGNAVIPVTDPGKVI